MAYFRRNAHLESKLNVVSLQGNAFYSQITKQERQ